MIKRVLEDFAGRSATMTKQGLQAVRVFKVETDSAEQSDLVDVLNHPDIPKRGDLFPGTTDVYCTSKNSSPLDDREPCFFRVTVNYGDVQSSGPSGDVDSPLFDKARISFGVREVARYDGRHYGSYLGDGVTTSSYNLPFTASYAPAFYHKNSAHRLMEDIPPREEHMPVIRIERNLKRTGFNPHAVLKISGSLNNGVIRVAGETFAKHQLFMKNISPAVQMASDSPNKWFWQIGYEIWVDTVYYHRTWILNAGMESYNAAETDPDKKWTHIVNSKGKVTRDVPLNSGGTGQLAAGASPLWYYTIMNPEKDWTPLRLPQEFAP